MEKIQELSAYILKLNSEQLKKTNTLSYAGCWADLPESVFFEFTEKLIEKRQENRRRFNE